MYGSSFCMVTRRPRALSNRPSEEAVRPFPRALATPPVTKMCFVTGDHVTAPHRSRAGSGSVLLADAADAVEVPQGPARVDDLTERHSFAGDVERDQTDEHQDPNHGTAGQDDPE